MVQDPIQVLHAGLRQTATTRAPRLLVVGATGALGNEVLRRLAGSSAYASTEVTASEPIRAGLRGVAARVVPAEAPIAEWPPAAAETGVVLFDPPRLFYDRERALWTPQPQQLVDVARWMRASGVTTLAVVLPHAPGRLPEALKRGLASLDEHAVAALGFERLLVVRSARKPAAERSGSVFESIAHWMISVLKYMVPTREQPVRAQKVAELVSVALRLAPPGIHVAAPEVVWQAAQGETEAVARGWLGV